MLATDFMALPVLLATLVDEIRGFLAQPGQEVAAGQLGAQQVKPRQ